MKPTTEGRQVEVRRSTRDAPSHHSEHGLRLASQQHLTPSLLLVKNDEETSIKP